MPSTSTPKPRAAAKRWAKRAMETSDALDLALALAALSEAPTSALRKRRPELAVPPRWR